MDYGSTHVWLYDDSDEEFISDSELQEGMWLRCVYSYRSSALLAVSIMRFDSPSHTHSEDEDDEPLLLPVQSSLKQKQPQEVKNLTPRLPLSLTRSIARIIDNIYLRSIYYLCQNEA